MNAERRAIAEYYKKELSGISGLDFLKITPDSEPNWHIFGILVPPEHKYWIMDAIRAEGIIANVHYTPLHKNKFYQGYATDEEMPGSMAFFGRLLRLPIYPSLTQQERAMAAAAVRKVFGA
jgi:dTDP-4-amino-4,6-dideoxygalactose transaminase